MGLNDEIALVTGASRGIGRAIALELGARGATVVGTATSEQGAREISEALAGHTIRGTGMVLNVTNTDSIAAFFKSMQDDVGDPTVLVNNAGITRDNLLLRMKDEEWDAVIRTNLTAVFHMSKACLRSMMKARHGRIITITSVVGATGNPGQANYAATKAGVIGFTKSLAREVGSRGITVNAVAPGFIDTDMTRALSDEQRASLLEQIPLGRLGDPQDVACAVAFLASREAAYITGETLHVNGGMHMN
jgi:3-oxoacyl-[acyl-carrier protein] reductase